MRFEYDVQRQIRRRLMKKGLEIATLLADELGGADTAGALRALGLDAQPGEKPEEKLRRYLDLIEAKRDLLDTGDDEFGRCGECGIDLGAVALAEMPWADRCPPHAA